MTWIFVWVAGVVVVYGLFYAMKHHDDPRLWFSHAPDSARCLPPPRRRCHPSDPNGGDLGHFYRIYSRDLEQESRDLYQVAAKTYQQQANAARPRPPFISPESPRSH